MNQKLTLFYFEFTDLWKHLCELHSELLDTSCEEYLALLKSDIEKVHLLLDVKQDLMHKISLLDNDRNELIKKITEMSPLSSTEINNFRSIYDFLASELSLDKNNPLIRYHSVILELIEKIQEQNKKNRFFLNKALLSLQSIKKELAGFTKVETYGRTGERLDHCR